MNIIFISATKLKYPFFYENSTQILNTASVRSFCDIMKCGCCKTKPKKKSVKKKTTKKKTKKK